MALHETRDDRVNQRAVMDIILQTLQGTAFVGRWFRYVEKPTEENEHGHDFDVYLRDELVGVVEIKCRAYPSAFFKTHGYMISRGKLAYLWRQAARGVPAMLAFRTSDGRVYAAMIDYMVEHKRHWRTALKHQTETTNHGTQKRDTDDVGYCIPLDIFSQLY